jgi:aspartyl-tRNA(Asn)/glutamyl-tRNA(Gln) amidotransferase subunit A
MSEDPALLPATTLLERYRAQSLSPEEVTEACLARIERHNDTLNAFNLIDRDGARAAAAASAKRWRLGAPRGRLDGVPTAIKDIVWAAGWPTLRGSLTVDPDQPWDEDSPAVARLREHGAVLIGRTTTPEFGWKGVTDSPLTGITRNPWNPAKTPGGSSGGSAVAVAAGMSALALGTDGGGSIRIPAGFTGIFGHKPTFGRVPAYPPSPFGTLSHVGPMTRTVADAALMLTVLAEGDPRDGLALRPDGSDYAQDLAGGVDGGVEGLKLAYSPSLGGHTVEPEVAELVRQAVARFEALGAEVEECDPEIPDCGPIFIHLWFAGAAAVVDQIDKARRAKMDPGLLEVAKTGARYSLFEYLAAARARDRVASVMSRFHRRYDLLLTPCLPLTAFDVGLDAPLDPHGESWANWTPFTYPFNLTGQPAASVPCGLAANGLPVGLQIVGARYADALVLRAARAFERAAPAALPPL